MFRQGYINGFWRVSLLSVAFLCGSVPPLSANILSDPVANAIGRVSEAGVSQRKEEDEDERADNLQFLAIPVPIVEPTLGNGLALAGLATFRVDEQDLESNRSTLFVGVARTDNGSEFRAAGGQLIFDRNRYQGNFIVGDIDLNFDFYGLGGAFLAKNPIPFEIDAEFFRVGGAVRVLPSTYLGVNYYYAKGSMKVNNDRPIFDLLTLNITLSGIGLTGDYDTRDSSWYPESGNRFRGDFTRFDDNLGSRDTFATAEANFTHYRKLDEGVVLAANTRAAYADSKALFFMNPFVSLRGFPALRFSNRYVFQGQAELRWFPFQARDGFLSKVGFVGFSGGGVATESPANWRDEPIAYAGGVGLRYRISEVDRINVGFDVAVGRDDERAIYFRIGEAF